MVRDIKNALGDALQSRIKFNLANLKDEKEKSFNEKINFFPFVNGEIVLAHRRN